ncbi:MAG: peptidoglycan DD-metalloendopeptidase family protein [Pseudomonadota bacterium]
MSPIINNYTKARSAVLGQIPRGHLIAAGVLSSSLLFMLILTPNREATFIDEALTIAIPVTPISPVINNSLAPQNFALADTTTLLVPAIEQVSTEPAWQELTVKSGDNLSSIFASAGLNDRDLYELFDGNKDAKDLRNIAPGQKMAILVDKQGKLQELTYFKNILDSLKFTRGTVGFVSQTINLKPEVRRSFREGMINSSLFMAGKQAGLPNNLTMELANIFGFDIDFALDIQKGDSFKVMYEEQYLDNKKIGTGAILAASFTNDGKTFSAVRYTNKDGLTRYFTPDGKAMNKAFLRMPIEFARISSGFNLNRLHPVLNSIRAHKGTDYAASTGTPIRTTGDGKVILAGRKGGYGNCVIVQHGQGYETLYGHMSNFAKGIRTGSRVSQGQVIGYVGQTGLATGPHLHYEFHVNGAVRNPVTVALPKAIGIDTNEKSLFLATTQELVSQLENLDQQNRLAMTEGSTKSN